MRKIRVLDNVYDLITINMEDRFKDHVAFRFYDTANDAVTTILYKDYVQDIRKAVNYFQSTIPEIKGKKICLLTKNSYEYAVNTFGVVAAGAVLVLLNTYPLVVSQNMVFRSKQTTMQSSVSVMVSALSGLDVLTEKNVAQAMTVAEEAAVSRVLVTDADGMVLYDDRETGGAVGRYALYTEITEALGGYDAFHSRYEDGAFRSRAASPVVYRGQIIGAVGTTAAAESGQPHLHFAVTKDGKAVDPNEYLSG